MIEKNELTLILEQVKKKLEEQRNCKLVINVESICTHELSASFYFVAKGSDGEKKYFLKRAIVSDSNKKINNEFKALKKLYPKFSKIKGCSVPKPILSIPALSVIVLEAYDFPSFDNRIKLLKYFKSKRAFDNLSKDLFWAGKWLKHLHLMSEKQIGTIDIVEKIVSSCKKRLVRLEDSGSKYLPNDFYSKTMGSLIEIKHALSNKKFIVMHTHGDFGIWNFLSKDDGIMVVDFATFCEEPQCVDIINMLMFLEDQSKNPFHNKKRIGILKQAFLNGYDFNNPLNIPKEIVLLCEFRERVYSLFGAVFPSKEWKNKFEINAVIKSHANWLYSTEDRKSIWGMRHP